MSARSYSLPVSQAAGDASLQFSIVDTGAITRLDIGFDASSLGSLTGSLAVLVTRPGQSAATPLLNATGAPVVIDLARPTQPVTVDLSKAAISTLVFSPVAWAVGQTVNVNVDATVDDGVLAALNGLLVEAAVEIAGLEDVIGLGAGDVSHASRLLEWRAYRLAIVRQIKAGTIGGAAFPAKPPLSAV